MHIPSKTELFPKLQRFLEKHNKTTITDPTEKVFTMYILASKTNKNSSTKEKLINYKLLRLKELFLEETKEPTERDLIISEFLIDELNLYYK